MKNFIEVHDQMCPKSPTLINVSEIAIIFSHGIWLKHEIPNVSSDAYISVTESYDELKKLIRIANGEEAEPRPIYYQVSDKDWPKLKAWLKEEAFND